ncbi:hypothetical protein [Streptomyces sp. NPDC090036]|uniref:hypothetical protein n=1 Tax=Streptomyces sp. NPDC090036 TaxID=3365926 RepID=UPI0037FD3AAC
MTTDPWEFQADCVEAFVASWRARGFSPVTVENDIGLLERTLTALGRPAWDVTPEDIGALTPDFEHVYAAWARVVAAAWTAFS